MKEFHNAVYSCISQLAVVLNVKKWLNGRYQVKATWSGLATNRFNENVVFLSQIVFQHSTETFLTMGDSSIKTF